MLKGILLGPTSPSSPLNHPHKVNLIDRYAADEPEVISGSPTGAAIEGILKARLPHQRRKNG